METSILEGKSGCLVALHACGDLSNQIIKTFIHSEKIRYLLIIFGGQTYYMYICKTNNLFNALNYTIFNIEYVFN